MLNVEEETALKTYMTNMAQYGHLLSIGQLRLKVVLMTQERPTPFIDGIPRRKWLCWFTKRHPNIRNKASLEIRNGICKRPIYIENVT